MSDPFTGEIRAFPFNFAPHGWAFCAGQVLGITQNTALFSLLGFFYGGNGETTFALPDLRGRQAVGVGTGPGLSPVTQGQTGGSEGVTLVPSQLPAHAHAIAPPVATTSTATSPVGLVPGLTTHAAYGSPSQVSAAPFPTAAAGGGVLPLDNRDPYLVLSWCIALTGIFPARP